MSRKLDVFLCSHYVGVLEQDPHGQLFFTYKEDWINKGNSVPLSQSLPLQKETFKKTDCLPFFSGILPEEEKREIIARNLGVSARNDFSLLERIGGECGGAVEFFPSGLPHHLPSENSYHLLSDKELSTLLKELSTRPLMAGERGVRLSLAGVQDKIPLKYENGQFYLPLESSPSTHIIKPAITRFEGQVYNEAYSLKLARSLNIPTAEAEWKNSTDLEYLLIKRYDRSIVGNKIQRIHQEDFCQALGIVPEKKYQVEGGPTLKQCFQLIRKVSSNPFEDLENLLKAVLFNLFIGNNDAHGKNFSLIYEKGKIRLAPLYDLIATAYYKDLDPHMAMKFGGESDSLKLGLKHIESFSKEVSMSKSLVLKEVIEMGHKILEKSKIIDPTHPQEAKVASFIVDRVKRFLTVLG